MITLKVGLDTNPAQLLNQKNGPKTIKSGGNYEKNN